jgi:hypothetical protein
MLKKSIFEGSSKMPRCKAPEIPGRERIYAFLTKYPPQQACPVLDTGKDGGNAADGCFSAA